MGSRSTTVFWSLLSGFVFTCVVGHAQINQKAQTVPTVFNTTAGEINPKTPEISTDELKSILAEGKALILDTRSHLEWAISHIPGALNVAPKPGMPMSQYTSDVAGVNQLTKGNKAQALILYCNGPYCGKSKRVAEDLLTTGYTNVRHYQLGVPVWRALGEVMVIEPDGVRYLIQNHKTAVFIDARDTSEFQLSSLPGARNIGRSKVVPGEDVGEVKAAKDDGRLPMEDHSTRIIVFGNGSTQAGEVAEALARAAFHNVSYFQGSYEQLRHSLQ